MSSKTAEISVQLNQKDLSVKVKLDGQLYWRETRIPDLEVARSLVLFWVLNALKPVFSEMPLERLEISQPRPLPDALAQVIGSCETILTQTNRVLTDHAALAGVASGYRNRLIVNTDDNPRYLSFLERAQELGGPEVFYFNMSSGFDKTERVWKQAPTPIPVGDLIARIQADQLRVIVGTNHYFLEKYLFNDGVNLIPLFAHLGVEFIILDNDPYEGSGHGFLMKTFFNEESFRRFSLETVSHQIWDRHYDLDNIQYAVCPQEYGGGKKTPASTEAKEILVLSHCRLQNVKPHLMEILYLLDHFEEESLLYNPPLWYLSLRHLILESMPLTELEIHHYTSKLFLYFYSLTQFLKYVIIDSIDDSTKIHIYGDPGWSTVFPEYYENRYLDDQEMNSILSQDKYIYLLLNYSFTYLDTAGAAFDSIRHGAHFINYSPTVATEGPLRGFRHLEYNNSRELNALIQNYNTAVNHPEVDPAIAAMQSLCVESTEDMEQQIFLDAPPRGDELAYSRLAQQNDSRLQTAILRYIDENEVFLRDTFDIFFRGKQAQYDPNRSALFAKPYVQRILRS